MAEGLDSLFLPGRPPLALAYHGAEVVNTSRRQAPHRHRTVGCAEHGVLLIDRGKKRVVLA